MASNWTIIHTTEFHEWCESLNPRSARSVNRKLELLRIYGSSLGRPHVDHIKGSKHPNLKELRISGDSAVRIFFCFDSRRQAVLLTGGHKSARRDWYKQMIHQADQIMDKHVEKEEMK